jgi:hypothetical protein
MCLAARQLAARRFHCLSSLSLSLLPLAGAITPQFSELWGQNGERFTPNGRLLDYSFAGMPILWRMRLQGSVSGSCGSPACLSLPSCLPKPDTGLACAYTMRGAASMTSWTR